MRKISFDSIEYVPAGHEDPHNPGVLKKVLLQKTDLQTGRIQMVNWALLPSGNSFASHYHEDMQELFIVVRGTVETTVNDRTVALGPGDTIVVDPREVHRMVNRGSADAEYLAIGITREEGGKTVVVE